MLVAALVFGGAALANAEINHYTYDMTRTTADTLESLGSKFVFGCVVLAVAIVAAAVIARKK